MEAFELTDGTRPRSLWSKDVTGVVWDLALPDDGSLVAAGVGIASGRTETEMTGELLVLARDGRHLWSRRSTKGVHRVGMTEDGSVIVATVDDQIQAFSVSGELLWKHEMPSRAWLVTVSSDGGTIVSASSHRMDVLDRFGKLQWSHTPAGVIESVALPRAGSLLAVASWDWIDQGKISGPTVLGTLSVLEASGRLRWNRQVRLVAACEDDVHLPVAVSADGSVIALGSPAVEGRLFVFRGDGAALWSDPRPDDILATASSREGAVLALGSSDFEVHVFAGPPDRAWTQSTGGDEGHMAGDFALTVSSTGALIAAGSGDANLYLFDRRGNKLVEEPMGARPQSIRFSEDGSLAAGSKEGTLRTFEIR